MRKKKISNIGNMWTHWKWLPFESPVSFYFPVYSWFFIIRQKKKYNICFICNTRKKSHTKYWISSFDLNGMEWNGNQFITYWHKRIQSKSYDVIFPTVCCVYARGVMLELVIERFQNGVCVCAIFTISFLLYIARDVICFVLSACVRLPACFFFHSFIHRFIHLSFGYIISVCREISITA